MRPTSVTGSIFITRLPFIFKRKGSLVMKIEPVTLVGRIVRLEPLQMKHSAELYKVSQDPAIWTYMPVYAPRSCADMEQVITTALQGQDAGTCQPFAVIDLAQG